MVSMKEMGRLDAERAPPAWLHPLLATTFFEPCPKHPAAAAGRWTRTTGCNFFCTDCAGDALCSACCLADHAGHRLIQIRRTSGHSVVKVPDLKPLLNVSFIQTYVYNSEAAVFLDKRPVSAGKEKAAKARCEECNWGLKNANCRFCSLRCKADGIEDKLDFCVSFAVNPNHNNSGEEPESDDEEHQVWEGSSQVPVYKEPAETSTKP